MILFDWNPESRSPSPVRSTSFSYPMPYPDAPDETILLLIKTDSSGGFAVHSCTTGYAIAHPWLLLPAPLVLNAFNLKLLPHPLTIVPSFYRSIVLSFFRSSLLAHSTYLTAQLSPSYRP